MANTKINFKRGAQLFNTNTQTAVTTLTLTNSMRFCEPWVNTTAKQLWVDDACINPNPISTNNALTINEPSLSSTSPYRVSRAFTINISGDANNALVLRADGLYSSDTNTHYNSKNIITNTTSSITETTTSLVNGNVCLNHIENDETATSGHRIVGTGVATVTWNASSNQIEIYAPNQEVGDISLGRLCENTGLTSGWFYTGGFYAGDDTDSLKWGIYHTPRVNSEGSLIEFKLGEASDITNGNVQIQCKVTIIDGGTF